MDFGERESQRRGLRSAAILCPLFSVAASGPPAQQTRGWRGKEKEGGQKLQSVSYPEKVGRCCRYRQASDSPLRGSWRASPCTWDDGRAAQWAAIWFRRWRPSIHTHTHTRTQALVGPGPRPACVDSAGQTHETQQSGQTARGGQRESERRRDGGLSVSVRDRRRRGRGRAREGEDTHMTMPVEPACQRLACRTTVNI